MKKLTSNINSHPSTEVTTCNCRKKEECPLSGQCLKSNLVYQAEVRCQGKRETYVGLTSTDFKTRHRNHKNSFNDPKKKLSTELSKYIWDIKDKGNNFEIHWKILCHAKPYSNITKRCNLCLAEKYFIICKPEAASLNKRSELISKCRHQAKFLIGNVT